VVVSGGTALTVDLVTANGLHLGGYIAPGRRAAARALWQSTDGLDDARRDFAPRLQPGATTLDCVAAGLTLFFRGFASELRQRIAAELTQPQWIFTGGDAEALLHLFAESDGDAHAQVVVPELVLEGLAIALP
jgi:type III pantothenate kinase